MTIVAILVLFIVLLPTIYYFVTSFFDIIVDGFKFVFSVFTIVPNFLFSEFIPNFPPFFQTAFFGLLGFILFILGTKIILSIK